jgi:hypothetical protein
VTLACEDGTIIEAHKVVLFSGSTFFSKMFEIRNSHHNPLIYMRGLKGSDLTNVVDFLYNGEVNIYQDDLEYFLQLAEELQLKGLVNSSDAQMKDPLTGNDHTAQRERQNKKELAFKSSNYIDDQGKSSLGNIEDLDVEEKTLLCPQTSL